MNIIRKNLDNGTWQWIDEALPALVESHIRECGMCFLTPMLWFDNDDPACGYGLDEGNELVECDVCCTFVARDHECEPDVPPAISLPANAYDHSEAR